MTNDAKTASDSSHIRISKRRLRLGCLTLLGAALLLALLHPLWLTAAAQMLILNQQPVPSDIILVLGGGAGEREGWAAELYQQGYAPIVVASGEMPHLPGETRSFAAISASYLESLGVPGSAIMTMTETTSTYDEALQSLELMRELGATSMIVITDPYHSRRAALTFRKVFRGQGTQITFSAAPDSWFSTNRWWTRERELLAVFEEYEKGIYYLIKGRLF